MKMKKNYPKNIKRLNFSCADDIREGWDNCDIQRRKDVWYIDADVFPYTIMDDYYDYILLKQCLYEFLYPRRVLNELWRISKEKAIIDIEVGYWNNKGSYIDMDTLHYFNEQTFIQFCKNNCRIDKTPKFKLVYIKYEKPLSVHWIPLSVCKTLSIFFSGFISKMYVRLEVLK